MQNSAMELQVRTRNTGLSHWNRCPTRPCSAEVSANAAVVVTKTFSQEDVKEQGLPVWMLYPVDVEKKEQ